MAMRERKRARRMAATMTAATALTLWPAPATQAGEECCRLQLAQLASTPVRFDIPPQPLASALTRFGEQAGLNVLVPAERVAGIASPGVSGELAPQAALDRLLSGTSLIARMADAGTVTVEAVAGNGALVLDPITVEAQAAPPTAVLGTLPPPFAGGQVARGGQLGVLGNRDIMDTPFNSKSFTAKLIEDKQTRTLSGVFAADPSVRSYYGDGGGDDRLLIRGFYVQNWAINGLYGVAPRDNVALEPFERIELIKGPTAFLLGFSPQGEVGGAINLVPKRAGPEPQAELTARYVSDSILGGHVDVGRRFGKEGQFGTRVNAFYRDGETAVDDAKDRFGGVWFGNDYAGEQLRVSLDLGYQSRDLDSPQRGLEVSPGFSLPAPPSSGTNFYQPWTYWDRTDALAIGRAEYDILPDLTAFVALGGAQVGPGRGLRWSHPPE